MIVASLIVLLIGGLVYLTTTLTARSSQADRILFPVDVPPVTMLSALPIMPSVQDQFRLIMQPRTGIDTALFIAPVQRYQPGSLLRPEVQGQDVPLPFPTTQALVTNWDGTLPQGCAPAGLPAAGTLNQPFHALHAGLDIGVQAGTPVLATHSAYVVFAGWNEVGYGNLVILQNDAFITYYAHNSALSVQTGDAVRRGTVIAVSGNTGNSTGPHSHYEVRLFDVPVDPLTFAERGYATC